MQIFVYTNIFGINHQLRAEKKVYSFSYYEFNKLNK